MSDNQELKDQVALVTGASRGIGMGIARQLGAMGATVVVTATTQDGADRAAATLVEAGGASRGIQLDISDPDSVSDTIKGLLADYAKIPILINNAGITRDSLLLRMKPTDWDDVIQTNLAGVWRLCKSLVPSMVRGRYGRIVNITSVVAAMGNPGQANYCAAKAGVEGMSRSLARELASRNITVNCVAPGFIDTDMTQSLSEAQREGLLAQVPLGRLGTPEDVARAVAYLVGESGSYVTGTTLQVNGGMSM